MCADIRVTAYRLYDLCTEAYKRYHKKTTLTQIDITHEQLRMKIYLAYELGYFSFSGGRRAVNSDAETEGHRYLAITNLVDELGRLIGAWISTVKTIGEW